ncbi:PadR family transcriptional regulator [Jatrophihabitans sp.]|jgi:DNA-binding PadR family transcriptional regulator|uniref:PadR family transcriptional regulator n=1 Tax=Jatrophihabitans sp. TaxID=1932789 RepID=UPI002F0526C9
MSVKHALLTLLDRGPMHGYQLRTEFEASTGATWPLNIGQVYSTLARLERDGLVVPAEGGDESQRLYAITEAGHDEVAAWFATPVAGEPARNEVTIKLAFAAGTPGLDVAEVVQIQRRATMKALQDYTRARERAGTDLAWQLVADSLIFAAEAEVRWLDHCEAKLARAAALRSGPRPASQVPSAPAERSGSRR